MNVSCPRFLFVQKCHTHFVVRLILTFKLSLPWSSAVLQYKTPTTILLKFKVWFDISISHFHPPNVIKVSLNTLTQVHSWCYPVIFKGTANGLHTTSGYLRICFIWTDDPHTVFESFLGTGFFGSRYRGECLICTYVWPYVVPCSFFFF